MCYRLVLQFDQGNVVLSTSMVLSFHVWHVVLMNDKNFDRNILQRIVDANWFTLASLTVLIGADGMLTQAYRYSLVKYRIGSTTF
jgi:hypothetical protein